MSRRRVLELKVETSLHNLEHGIYVPQIRELIANEKLHITGESIPQCCIFEYVGSHVDDIVELKFIPSQKPSIFRWQFNRLTHILHLDVSFPRRYAKSPAICNILHVVEKSPSLTHLNLSGNLMNVANLRRLMSCIGDNKVPNLSTLNLSGCIRTKSRVGSTLANLKILNNFAHLDVSSNRINITDLNTLCCALGDIDSFIEFNSGHCQIENKVEGIVKLIEKSTSLTKLNLNKNGVGSSGIYKICEAIISNEDCRLIELNLSKNTLGCHGSDAMARLISENRSIEILHMYGVRLYTPRTYNIIQSLERNSTIKWLDLGATMLHSGHMLSPKGPCSWDIEAKRYALMEDLSDINTGLYVPFDEMKPPYALGIAIANNYSITTLMLNGVHFSDNDIGALLGGLVKNETLTCLSLRTNGLGVKSLTRIANYIAGPTKDDPRYLMERECNIRTLILGNNNITRNGFGTNQARIVNGPNLTSLDLSHNPISTGARFIFDALESNETLINLNLSNCGITSRTTFVNCLRNNKSLESIDLSMNPMCLSTMGVTPSTFKGFHIRTIRLPGLNSSRSFRQKVEDILAWNSK